MVKEAKESKFELEKKNEELTLSGQKVLKYLQEVNSKYDMVKKYESYFKGENLYEIQECDLKKLIKQFKSERMKRILQSQLQKKMYRVFRQ